MQRYRKALNPKNGCPYCGQHIGVTVNEGWICTYCGTNKEPNTYKKYKCTCWLGICAVHDIAEE